MKFKDRAEFLQYYERSERDVETDEYGEYVSDLYEMGGPGDDYQIDETRIYIPKDLVL